MERRGASLEGVRVTLNAEHGIVVSGMLGWEDVVFNRLTVALVDGAPALVGFAIEPAEGHPLTRLTSKRLARVPVGELARLAAQFGAMAGDGDVFDRMRELAMRFEMPERPRGAKGDELAEFHRAILTLSEIAKAEGVSAIAKIQDATGVGRDRAKQYSAAARKWKDQQSAAQAAKEGK